MNWTSNLTPKQKQRMALIAVMAGFIALVIASTFATKTKSRKEIAKEKSSKKMSLLTDKVEKDLWIAAEGQNVKAIEKSNEELRTRVDQLVTELKKTKDEMGKQVLPRLPASLPPLPPVPKVGEARPVIQPKAPEQKAKPPGLPSDATLFPAEETAPFGKGPLRRPSGWAGVLRKGASGTGPR